MGAADAATAGPFLTAVWVAEANHCGGRQSNSPDIARKPPRMRSPIEAIRVLGSRSAQPNNGRGLCGNEGANVAKRGRLGALDMPEARRYGSAPLRNFRSWSEIGYFEAMPAPRRGFEAFTSRSYMNHSSLIRVTTRMKVLFAGAAALLLLAGCGGSERVCTNPDEPYLSARNNEPLRVPSGMETPDRSEALAIPDVKPGQTKSGRTACLDEPPSYFRSAGTVARSPEEVIASWAQAWASREADAVIALYSTGFTAPTDAAGSAAWLEQRREQVATGPTPDAIVEGLTLEQDGPDRRVAKFVQKFGANALRKELTLVRESGSWRIVEENVAGVK